MWQGNCGAPLHFTLYGYLFAMPQYPTENWNFKEGGLAQKSYCAAIGIKEMREDQRIYVRDVIADRDHGARLRNVLCSTPILFRD
jgi:nuclear transport factor 2 (NTF2) superfamily protein